MTALTVDEVTAQPERAVARRTFAIISHPDAGKTTLTEKLLLYGGAIEEAGAVKARSGRQRQVTSDWMEMERRRGISISSTVMQFTYRDTVLNLLDTPGHRDFSEDTYRVLSAVDAAVIVLDAAKGIEEQTLKLFQVAQSRGLPLITLVNKCDRPALDPLEICDDIQERLGIQPTPITWPIGLGHDFAGVIDRRDGALWSFARTAHGATVADETRVAAEHLSGLGSAGSAALTEVALLDEIEANHASESFLHGRTTPTFFGSALWNFGIRLVLDAVVDLVPPPAAPIDDTGTARSLNGPFSGFVFKIQANLDPHHRDRIAFLRVNTGRFTRGMRIVNVRTGREIGTKYAQQVFGRDRDTIEVALPGDVVGLVNAGDLRIGDTVTDGPPFRYPPIPAFAPEFFMSARNVDSSRSKQFRRGMTQLDEEGVIQVLTHPDRGGQEILLGAVGPMQYEVAAFRMEHEFGASIELSTTPYKVARRTDQPGAAQLVRLRNVEVYQRSDGTHLALFPSRHHLDAVIRDHPRIALDTIVTT